MPLEGGCSPWGPCCGLRDCDHCRLEAVVDWETLSTRKRYRLGNVVDWETLSSGIVIIWNRYHLRNVVD